MSEIISYKKLTERRVKTLVARYIALDTKILQALKLVEEKIENLETFGKSNELAPVRRWLEEIRISLAASTALTEQGLSLRNEALQGLMVICKEFEKLAAALPPAGYETAANDREPATREPDLSLQAE